MTYHVPIRCPKCLGKSRLKVHPLEPLFKIKRMLTCNVCYGLGYIEKEIVE